MDKLQGVMRELSSEKSEAEKAQLLEQLGYWHGRRNVDWSKRLMDRVSSVGYRAYRRGLVQGDRAVCNDPLVDSGMRR